MSKLDLVEQVIYQIKTQVQNNSKIRKLLLYDTVDALEIAAEVPFVKANDYIVVSPIFDMTKEPFNKNTIISIAITKALKAKEEKIFNGMIKINVLTHSELWPLDNNKIRPLEISSILIDLLDEAKMASSHKLVFNALELAILTKILTDTVLHSL